MKIQLSLLPMFKYAMVLCAVCFFVAAHATPLVSKSNIPPFNITLANGKHFNAGMLKKSRPLMLVYFSPDCGHCQNFTEALLQKVGKLKSVQIVMITYQPLADTKIFEQRYKLSTYPNISVGTEGYSFVVQRYFDIQKFPFVALFDKKGALIQCYKDAPFMEEIMKAFSINE